MHIHKFITQAIMGSILLMSNVHAKELTEEATLPVLRTEVPAINAPVLVKEARGRLETKQLKSDSGFKEAKVGQRLLIDEIIILHPYSRIVLKSVNGAGEVILETRQETKWYTLK